MVVGAATTTTAINTTISNVAASIKNTNIKDELIKMIITMLINDHMIKASDSNFKCEKDPFNPEN